VIGIASFTYATPPIDKEVSAGDQDTSHPCTKFNDVSAIDVYDEHKRKLGSKAKVRNKVNKKEQCKADLKVCHAEVCQAATHENDENLFLFSDHDMWFHHNPDQETLATLEQIIDAYNNDGIMVSAAQRPTDKIKNPPDTSGTILQKLLPRGLYGFTGAIFSPSMMPESLCGYTIDADSNNRYDDSDMVNDRCGKSREYIGGKSSLIGESGACPADQTPEEYAQFYFNNDNIMEHTCHHSDVSKTLNAQVALFTKIEASGTNFPSSDQYPISFFNEFVLSQGQNLTAAAYFWVRLGSTTTNLKDYVQNAYSSSGSSSQRFASKAICCIAGQKCKEPEPRLPLIQISNYFIPTSNMDIDGYADFNDVKTWKTAYESGGWDAANIFTEVNWNEICSDDFLKDACKSPFPVRNTCEDY